ncbi:uncharacterized protein N7518_010066 [Penicillium psychrosexuale]|uniref:uncharacterized protein n=1 Tax=Penicillium psychrosexuale TaxID=1002107 RepID=UPI002545672B|nr:uncharacterized protein N7518_010066 [Penicillium psychrosexuale]KAJ5781583.1 hypothetical protein N7518_010066 [Penicillium psychrosexuale]
MKASFIATVAAMAGSAFAAPTTVVGADSLLVGLKIGDITAELKLSEIPVVYKLGDLTNILDLPTPSSSISKVPAVKNGHLVQDLGHEVDNILTVVGEDLTTLLIELSPEVTALVDGLGLGSLGAPLGSIVASASDIGGIVSGLGSVIDGLVTVVGADAGALLISLSPEVAGLVSGLGLPTIGVPVGTVIATVGQNLKRGEIVQDLAPVVQSTITVVGQDAEDLLIELSPSVTSLVASLGLTSVAGPIGSVVAEAATVGELVKDISVPVADLLHIVGRDGKNLLIKLTPSVVGLVAGLGLPTIASPLGAILTTVARNL